MSVSRSYPKPTNRSRRLCGKCSLLAAQLQDADDKMMNVQHFLKAVRKYTQPEKLTAAMLRELVEKVVVYAPDKSSGHRVQRIDVYYTFIGKIDFSPEYSKRKQHDTFIPCCSNREKCSLSVDRFSGSLLFEDFGNFLLLCCTRRDKRGILRRITTNETMRRYDAY